MCFGRASPSGLPKAQAPPATTTSGCLSPPNRCTRGTTKAGKDVLAQFCHQVPEAQLYQGKHLILGGSSALVKEGKNALKGDLSAIIVRHLAAMV